MLNTFKRKTNSQGGLLLADALDRGIGLGAHFIEVYAVEGSPRRAGPNAIGRQVALPLAMLFEKLVEQTSAFIAS